MSRSASKIRDIKSSVQKEFASLKNRRSVSVDTRSRGSYVPDKKRPSSEERISGNKFPIRQWGSDRRSSLKLNEQKRIKDTRPLSDKAYQKKKISDLVEFLEENGFSPPISASKLISPSKTDFENIFQFLYRNFDVTYQVNRIEEEAPKILKLIGYPFTVNKSAFLCVTRTNWPSLLGILLWLMDLCMFSMKVDMKCLFETAGDDDDNATMHKILVNYICQCHHSTMDDEEQESDVYREIIKTYILKEDFDDLLARKEEKKIQLEEVEQKINEMKNLAAVIINQEKQIEKCEEYIKKMTTHYQHKNSSYEQLLQELKEKEGELKVLHEQVSKKQDAYDAQGFDGQKHLGYFENQKKELNEKYETKQMLFKQLQDMVWEAEIKLKKMSERASAAAEDYKELSNSIIESLKEVLDPLLNIKTSQIQYLCRNFQFDFPDYQYVPSEGNLQADKNLLTSWKAIAEKVKNVDDILKKIHSTFSQNLTELEMKEAEDLMQLKLLSLEENKQEQDLNSKKKIADDEVSTLESQCKKIQDAISALQVESSELEKTYKEMIEESKCLHEMLETKERELREYLVAQKEKFDYYSRTEKEVLLKIQAYGNELAQKLKEEIKTF